MVGGGGAGAPDHMKGETMMKRSKARAATVLAGVALAAGVLGVPGALAQSKVQKLDCPSLPGTRCIIETGGRQTRGIVSAPGADGVLATGPGFALGEVGTSAAVQQMVVRGNCVEILVKTKLGSPPP